MTITRLVETERAGSQSRGMIASLYYVYVAQGKGKIG